MRKWPQNRGYECVATLINCLNQDFQNFRINRIKPNKKIESNSENFQILEILIQTIKFIDEIVIGAGAMMVSFVKIDGVQLV